MSEIKTHPDLKKPTFSLVGTDGNAFAVMAVVRRELQQAGNSQEVIDAYLEEAKSGDYDHLLAVSEAYIDDPLFNEEENDYLQE